MGIRLWVKKSPCWVFEAIFIVKCPEEPPDCSKHDDISSYYQCAGTTMYLNEQKLMSNIEAGWKGNGNIDYSLNYSK